MLSQCKLKSIYIRACYWIKPVDFCEPNALADVQPQCQRKHYVIQRSTFCFTGTVSVNLAELTACPYWSKNIIVIQPGGVKASKQRLGLDVSQLLLLTVNSECDEKNTTSARRHGSHAVIDARLVTNHSTTLGLHQLLQHYITLFLKTKSSTIYPRDI